MDLYLLRFLVQLKTKIQPVHPKGDQSWVFIGRTDIEAETPILWPSDAKSWLIWKDDAGKDWGQEKGMTEDEMVGWHHWLNGHGFGWTLGVGDGQGGLACCGSWGCKESDTTERLNWTGFLVSWNCVLCVWILTLFAGFFHHFLMYPFSWLRISIIFKNFTFLLFIFCRNIRGMGQTLIHK